jgi:hypothetical protein
MATYIKIASNTVGVGGATSVAFSSIPATYTDLQLVVSSRIPNSTPQPMFIRFNGSTASYSQRYIEGTGSSVGSTSYSGSLAFVGASPGSSYTANTFGNSTVYIANYRTSNSKSFSSEGVTENNGTVSYSYLYANLWAVTDAITSMTIFPNGDNFVQYSTFTLYGISNA